MANLRSNLLTIQPPYLSYNLLFTGHGNDEEMQMFFEYYINKSLIYKWNFSLVKSRLAGSYYDVLYQTPQHFCPIYIRLAILLIWIRLIQTCRFHLNLDKGNKGRMTACRAQYKSCHKSSWSITDLSQ